MQRILTRVQSDSIKVPTASGECFQVRHGSRDIINSLYTNNRLVGYYLKIKATPAEGKSHRWIPDNLNINARYAFMRVFQAWRSSLFM